MPYIEDESFEWTQEGTEPTTTKKTTGWELNEKPFYGTWNWLTKKISNLTKNADWLQENKANTIDVVPITRTINGTTLENNITLGYADVGAVPTGRKINGYDLTVDRDLTASDVSAIALADQTTVERAFMLYNRVVTRRSVSSNKMHLLSSTEELELYVPATGGTVYILSNPYIVETQITSPDFGAIVWTYDSATTAQKCILLQIPTGNSIRIRLEGSNNNLDWITIQEVNPYTAETLINVSAYRYIRLYSIEIKTHGSIDDLVVYLSENYISEVVSSTTIVEGTGKAVGLETSSSINYQIFEGL